MTDMKAATITTFVRQYELSGREASPLSFTLRTLYREEPMFAATAAEMRCISPFSHWIISPFFHTNCGLQL